MRTVTGHCPGCDQDFTRRANGGADRGLFCSKGCANSYNTRRRPSRAVAQRPCETCPRCGGRRSDSRTGSICRPCRAAERVAVLASTTLGDLRATYSISQYHAKIRGMSRVVLSDRSACTACGYAKHTEVCHVRPVADFPPTATLAEVNHPDNLVALCPNCHWEFDHGLLQLP